MNVTKPMSVCLQFANDVPQTVRARISYAFRVFAAIYGHEVVDVEQGANLQCCVYGAKPGESAGSKFFHIPARYVVRSLEEQAPRPEPCSFANEELYLFYGRDEVSGNPDWLGEIFEWLSSADEMSIAARDSIGRIPFASTVFGRQSISPLRPYASLLMAWFQGFLNDRGQSESLPRAPSPVNGADHLMICSHDIDFYFTGRLKALVRVIKNAAAAILLNRSYPHLRGSVGQLFQLICGKRVGDFLPELLHASRTKNFSSTFFVIARHGHRRDGTYKLEEIMPRLREVPKQGSFIGLHGSYESIVEASDLVSETAALSSTTQQVPMGSRQHWLRFGKHNQLFTAIEKAGLKYDSTLGFSQMVGFRNGAAFAFPPYSFDREEAYDFMEIPLAVMDSALATASRSSYPEANKLLHAVLGESRRWGWGGIALLWHDPIEPLGVPYEINRIFWDEMNARAGRNDSGLVPKSS